MMKHLILAMLACGIATAAPVSVEQARTAAANWAARDAALGCRLGAAVADSRVCEPADGEAFYIVGFEGGGFAVLSSDTEFEPVIAFSDEGGLDESADNPFWALLLRDARERGKALAAIRRRGGGGAAARSVEWEDLLSPGPRDSRSAASVSDVRVAPLVKSRWSQSTVGDRPCYNYYTPSNYVCGCVATGGAQIMRYFEWPLVPMPQYTCNWCSVDDENVPLTTIGGIYDWASMPLTPTSSSSITDSQCRTIGKLTYDVGVCCGMQYSLFGSGAGTYMLPSALKKHFGYSGAVSYLDADGISAAVAKRAIVSNLDAGLPVLVGISDEYSGHAVVGDGYGYIDGTIYYHLNYGWGATGIAWYAPPDLDAAGYTFNVLDSLVYNIYTNQAAGSSICSGRVLDADGNPVYGALVTARSATGAPAAMDTTDANGIYALVAPPAQYTVEAVFGEYSVSRSVTLSACVSLNAIDSDDQPSFGSYYSRPVPVVGNLCDQDLVFGNIESVAAPVFNPGPCVFHPSIAITISCATANAIVFYTLDGTVPTSSSTRYTGPVTLSASTTIKARAYRSGMSPSLVAVASYTYDIGQDCAQGDYFSNPVPIQGASGSHTIADISVFTTEDGEPTHTSQGTSWYRFYNTAWFEWTAPSTGETTLNVSANRSVGNTVTRYPAFVAVYEGDSLSSVSRVALSTDHDTAYVTRLTFDSVSGVTYRIACMLGSKDVPSVVPLTLSWNSVPLTSFYVDASAAGDGSGHASSPFSSIGSALAAAPANSSIHVRPGIYRECVEPALPVSIIADDGPESTFIDGEGVRRCYSDQSSIAGLSGFTLRNGSGDYGGAVYGGVLTNCVIRDSRAYYGAGAYGATLYGCTVIGNRAASYGGGAAESRLERCTVILNTSEGTGAGLDCYCEAAATICWGNTLIDGTPENWEEYYAGESLQSTRFDFSCTTPLPVNGGTNITDNPCLVYTGDTAYADWRLRDASPCIAPGFISGNIGAYQGRGVQGHIVVASVVGHGDISPRIAAVDDGGSATFTATGYGDTRPFDHFELDGAFAGVSNKLTISGVHSDHSVTAFFHEMVFHVDGATGSDSNSGASWDEPLRTIQRAVDENLGGEKILVRPGTYNYVVVGRVPVEIVSTDGAGATAIRGTSGHRCFTAGDADTIVRGFTLRGGANTNLTAGGAFYGTLVDCVISNCTARNGGGAVYSVLMNCVVTGNRATQAGGGVYDCDLADCVVSGCEAVNGGGAVYSTLINSLVVGNGASQAGGGAYSCNLLNCTVTGNSAASSIGGVRLPANYSAVNCIIAGNTAPDTADLHGRGIRCFAGGDPLFVDPAHGDYRLAGGSPCIDAGYSEVSPGDADLGGAPRISGAAIDLGCYEYSQSVAVAPSESFESAAAQTRSFEVFADGAWVLSSDSGWLSPSPASGTGNATVTLQIAANATGAERTGAMTLRGAGANDAATLSVTQVDGTTGDGAHYGLFIGLNIYGTGQSQLVGCVSDAAAMRGRAIASGLWPAENASILTNRMATKGAVRAAIASIAAVARSGDTVLIYQASHGGNSEINNKDAFLCEYDGDYTDAEMASDLSAFATGVRVIVILDTCNSGGMFRSASALSPARSLRSGASSGASASASDGGWRFAERVASQIAARRFLATASAAPRSSASSHYASQPDVAFITAADYDQYSWDSDTGGMFTSALVCGWESGEADSDGDSLVNFRELHDYAAARATGFSNVIGNLTQAQSYNDRLLLRTLAREIVPPRVFEHGNAHYDDFREWLYQNQMITFAEIGDSERVAQVAQAPVSAGSESALYYYVVCGSLYSSLGEGERELTAMISLDAQGAPVVTWRPNLNESSRAIVREYRVLGAKSLDGEWDDVTSLAPSERASAGYRFFKVTASMP